ncbi:MAG TPA: DnaJ C-terminal domain-containing protein [Burkholderiaceae bacterium]|jgi:curved DNA-binding protein
MKIKDYYQILGIERSATSIDIKLAYRKLARKYHPDITKDAKGEEKFKEIAEAYATLKDPYRRMEYDNLDKMPEEEQEQQEAPNRQEANAVPPTSQQHVYKNQSFFSDVGFSDIFSGFVRNRKGNKQRADKEPVHGLDYEITASVTIEQIFHGEEVDINVNIPEIDKDGTPYQGTRTFRVKIPKGAIAGQRLRLNGKGGAGRNGGKPGNLYIVLDITRHPLYRISGSDLYMDLPLAPWEAVLGSEVKIPTLAGTVELNIKSGTTAGQKLRLPKRGLPSSSGSTGDLFAIIRVVAPKKISTREQQLYQQLATVSEFNPRQHFNLIR